MGLHSLEIRAILRADQGQGPAGTPGAAGPADPVDIIVGIVRHIEIEDMGDAADIQAAAGHVGAHEDAGSPLPKTLNDPLPVDLGKKR